MGLGYQSGSLKHPPAPLKESPLLNLARAHLISCLPRPCPVLASSLNSLQVSARKCLILSQCFPSCLLYPAAPIKAIYPYSKHPHNHHTAITGQLQINHTGVCNAGTTCGQSSAKSWGGVHAGNGRRFVPSTAHPPPASPPRLSNQEGSCKTSSGLQEMLVEG